MSARVKLYGLDTATLDIRWVDGLSQVRIAAQLNLV